MKTLKKCLSPMTALLLAVILLFTACAPAREAASGASPAPAQAATATAAPAKAAAPAVTAEPIRVTADLVVTGKIYTSDAQGTFAEAFAVKDGQYIYVGDAAGAQSFIGDDTKQIAGTFIMPSATESHAHIILEEAFKLGFYVCPRREDGTAKTPEEIVQDAAAYYAANPSPEGLFGYGYDELCFLGDGYSYDRSMLDAAFPDIPVYIAETSLHGGWCNTKCLELAGALTEEIPTHGVERDANGVATGVIRDEACGYVRNAVFGALDHYDQAVLNAQENLHAKGYTMLMDPWTNFDGTNGMGDAVAAADEAGDLKLVVFTCWSIPGYADIDAGIADAVNAHETHITTHSEQKYLKLFADGTETARTAYQLEPYGDGTYGTANWTDARMTEATVKANANGLLVQVHAFGDASARQTLDAYEASVAANGSTYRNSIAHAPYVSDSDLERIASLGIGVAGSGNWSVGSEPGTYTDYMNAMLGEQRYRDYYIVDKFVEYGIQAGVSTDRPCANGFAEDVFDYIGVLTTGIDYREGYAAPAKRDKWVSVEDAVRMLTINGAWTLDADSERGSIEIGKYADFIIADGDPFTTAPEEIHAINVEQTYFEGEKVFG